MEFYAVLGLDQVPRKFRSVGTSSELYCYFPPPLPDIAVIFCLRSCQNTTLIKDEMCIQLHLDGEKDSICKVIGEISTENQAICFDGFWDRETKLLAQEIQEKGRLLKLIISPKSSLSVMNDRCFSQDSGISELKPLSDNLRATKVQTEILDPEKDKEMVEKQTKDKEQKALTSPLMERNCTPKKVTSMKRKKMFEFDDDDDNDDENIKHVKFDSENHGKAKCSPKVIITPLSIKTKKIKNFFSPKSSKSSCKNIFPAKGSPVTPGISELEAPTARWGHSMCETVDKKAILVGGQGLRHQMCKDSLWQYDFSKSSWTRLEDDSKGASRRMGHTAVYDEKSEQIYIFGGCKNKKWYSDVHALNANTLEWKRLEVTGKAPARSYHSCTLSNEELLIFGGVFPNPDPIPDGCSNDVHCFSTVSSSWYKPIVNGERPKPRSGHSASLVQEKLFIFGGWDAPTCFDDLWTLDLGLMNFQFVKTTGQAPSPRSWHGSTLTRDNQSILIYGGYNGEKALNDVYLLKLTSLTWSNLQNDHLLSRAGHLLMNIKALNISKKQEDSIVVFGGGDNEGKFFNDISELQKI